MNFYLITLNSPTLFGNDAIHKVITENSNVDVWWHYLPNVYIIRTASTATFHSNRLINAFPGLTFFMTKIDLTDYNGYLPQKAWDWIKAHTKSTAGYRPLPNIKPLPPVTSQYSVPQLRSSRSALQDLLDTIKRSQ